MRIRRRAMPTAGIQPRVRARALGGACAGVVVLAVTFLVPALPSLAVASTGGNGSPPAPSLAAADWQRYVEGPSNPDVRPLKVVSTAGAVGDPSALVRPAVTGQGTTLAYQLDGLDDSGPDFWPAGTSASASSYHSANDGGSYLPSNALDGNPATYWNDATAGSTDSWLEITAPSPVTIPGISLIFGPHGVPVDFQVQTWDAGTNAWVTQVSVTGNSQGQVSEAFSAPVTTQQVRIFITLNQPAPGYGQYSRIAEVYPGLLPAQQPQVLLDYGKDVGGVPYLDVTNVSGTPSLRASYSESATYMSPEGDGTSFYPPPGLDTNRYDSYVVTSPGVITNSSVQGGERYEMIALTTPGEVTLSRVGIQFTAYDATSSKYQGWFLSSSNELNKIFYDGAYTTQLDMITSANGTPAVVDGAKRDHLIWLGDLAVEMPTILDTLGGNGAAYVRDSLLAALDATAPGPYSLGPAGSLPGAAVPGTDQAGFYSASYSMDAANDLVEYYQYTGDTAFAQQAWTAFQAQLAYDATLVDSAGLLATSSGNGADWDFYDGAKTGEVAAFNMIYYHTLEEGVYLAQHLGHPQTAASWASQAAALKATINAQLWDPSTGVYDLSTQDRGTYAQDANALAVLYGVADASQSESILTALKSKLWTADGEEPFAGEPSYSTLMSPFITGFETAARFQQGETDSAIALIERLWGPMTDPSNPFYSGAFWENVLPDGGIQSSNTSLAHGWSTGPAWQMSAYVLGVQPVGPGYSTWKIQPHPGSLSWAEGEVPTPQGTISVRWTRNGPSGGLTLQVSAPRGTSGTIVMPAYERDSVLYVNGHLAGQGPGTFSIGA